MLKVTTVAILVSLVKANFLGKGHSHTLVNHTVAAKVLPATVAHGVLDQQS